MSGYDRVYGVTHSPLTLLSEQSHSCEYIPRTNNTCRTTANIVPNNRMHPIAMVVPLVAALYLIIALCVNFAGGELSLILAVGPLIVIMMLGLVMACCVLTLNVQPNGTPTRSFREFLNGEVDVETGRISSRVAFCEIATIPIVVTIGSTLIMAYAAAPR
jgi:hypothetical protein